MWKRIPNPLSFFIPSQVKDAFGKDLKASILAGIFLAFTGPFIGVIARKQLGATPFQLSFISATSGIGQLLTFYWGCLVRTRSNKVRMVTLPGIVSRSMFLFMPLVYSINLFLFLILMYQIISFISTPAYAEVIGLIYPGPLRGSLMGTVRMITNLVVIIATPIAGQLVSNLGFRWTFFIGALFGISSSIVFSRVELKVIPRQPEHNLYIRKALSIPFKDKVFGSYLAIFFMYGVGNWLSNPIYPIVLVDRLHATSLQVGLLSTFTSLFASLSYIFWGRYIDKNGAIRSLSVAFFIAVGVPLGYLLATNTSIFLLVCLSAIISGVVNAGIDLGVMGTILKLSPKDEIPNYMALHSTFVGIRGIFGPFLGAFLYRFIDASGVFFINIVLILIGGFLMY
ncbi:MAG: MFS transporter, partial [bacterium]